MLSELEEMRIRTPGRTEGGAFTLVEIAVAAAVIGLLVIILSNLYISSLTAERHSQSQLQANLLASSLLEEMRDAPFQQLAALPDGSRTVDGVEYRYQTTLTVPSGSDSRFLKSLRATVEWEIRGHKKSLSRETWVHNFRR